MPIESVGSHNPSSCSPSRSARSPRNVRRCTSTSSVNGAIVISPSSFKCASAATRRASGAASPGAHPLFCVSPATLTCSSTRTAVPCAAARRSSSSASAAESSECTSANRPGTCFALLRCRCPIKCHVARPPAGVSIFARASWTRFSPRSVRPAASAASTASSSKPLVTATIVTGCVQPAAACRRAISPRTWASRSERAPKFITAKSSPLSGLKQSGVRGTGGAVGSYVTAMTRSPPSRWEIAPDRRSRTCSDDRWRCSRP